jgi:UDP-N-acetylmuramate dehydrogenase
VKRAEGLSLGRFNTFGVPATARHAVQLDAPGDLQDLAFDPQTDLVLGGGSNVLFVADVEGTVFLNRIRGMGIAAIDDERVMVQANGGEIWHSLVLWSLEQGLSGLENLALIPGLVGAAPIQNIGAYGVELSDRVESVEAWDWQARRLVRFANDECAFAYRDSRFKSADPDRFFVTSINLRLDREFRPALAYAGVREQLQALKLDSPTAAQVCRAIIAIRKRKLPNPARMGNAGSFFKNPVVSPDMAEDLRKRYEGLPAHAAAPQAIKLSAAWMIEHCGWKGHREGAAGVSDRHALVLVNHGGASGADILSLAVRIAESVAAEFGVRLEPEPRIVGADWPWDPDD